MTRKKTLKNKRKEKIMEEWRVKKETYMDNYGNKTVEFVPQRKGLIWGWWDDIGADEFETHRISFETRKGAKKHIKEQTRYETLIDEEIID